MADLATELVSSIRQFLPGKGSSPEDLYHSAVWTALRQEHASRRYWYKGKEWEKTLKGSQDYEGNPELQYPLQINLISKVCPVHRAVMMGVLEDSYDQVPIRTSVSRTGLAEQSQRDMAENLEGYINNLWWDNNGTSVQFESCLQEQYYGGHVFHLNWEPYNQYLPYRTSIYSLKSPGYLLPVAWSALNRWRLFECYIGYEIPVEVSKLQFGIVPEDKAALTVIYMEHWTDGNYKITVDGQVPVLKDLGGNEHKLEGENPWGTVPVVYIPHERDGEFYGRSLIDGDSPLIGLAKEQNARMADRGEKVRDALDVAWMRNARAGALDVRYIDLGGGIRIPVVDVGDSHLPGSPEPAMEVASIGGPADSAREYDDDIMTQILNQADVAPVALGMDDTASGRITGPVTAYRMWPTMMHTMAERGFYTDGLREVARIALSIGLWAKKKGQYQKAGVRNPPKLDEGMLDLRFGVSWRPMIPIEVETRNTLLNERLAAGGISVYQYLIDQGCPNPIEEEARIWADREKIAEIEAEAEATAMAARMQAMGGNNNE